MSHGLSPCRLMTRSASMRMIRDTPLWVYLLRVWAESVHPFVLREWSSKYSVLRLLLGNELARCFSLRVFSLSDRPQTGVSSEHRESAVDSVQGHYVREEKRRRLSAERVGENVFEYFRAWFWERNTAVFYHKKNSYANKKLFGKSSRQDFRKDFWISLSCWCLHALSDKKAEKCCFSCSIFCYLEWIVLYNCLNDFFE